MRIMYIRPSCSLLTTVLWSLFFTIYAFSHPQARGNEKVFELRQPHRIGKQVVAGTSALERACKNFVELGKKTEGGFDSTIKGCMKDTRNQLSVCKNMNEVLECYARMSNWNEMNGCMEKCNILKKELEAEMTKLVEIMDSSKCLKWVEPKLVFMSRIKKFENAGRILKCAAPALKDRAKKMIKDDDLNSAMLWLGALGNHFADQLDERMAIEVYALSVIAQSLALIKVETKGEKKVQKFMYVLELSSECLKLDVAKEYNRKCRSLFKKAKAEIKKSDDEFEKVIREFWQAKREIDKMTNSMQSETDRNELEKKRKRYSKYREEVFLPAYNRFSDLMGQFRRTRGMKKFMRFLEERGLTETFRQIQQ